MKRLTEAEFIARVKQIKLLLLDVDGVLTDGKLYFSSSGEELKAFHIQDGFGIKALQNSGVKVGIITGRESPLVNHRARELGINILIQKSPDKLRSLHEVASAEQLSFDQIAFMGDDYPDLPAITAVGLGFTVADGHRDVQARCHWISSRNGGEGAVREACDMLMGAQNSYEAALNKFLDKGAR